MRDKDTQTADSAAVSANLLIFSHPDSKTFNNRSAIVEVVTFEHSSNVRDTTLEVLRTSAHKFTHALSFLQTSTDYFVCGGFRRNQCLGIAREVELCSTSTDFICGGFR
ncbi:MAG: hypothetical protein LUG88_05865, partial [Clostridia bacterium]|nr:hypothetical protein [Clostridia bacterium]